MSNEDRLQTIVERLLERATQQGLMLRVCGGFAVWLRAGEGRAIAARAARSFSDVDFAAYSAQHREVVALLREEGFEEDAASATVPGLGRIIFSNAKLDLHGDVFLDRLVFTHTIELRGRLELHETTLTLADLLLQKLQIGRFTEKDAIDTAMLVHDHEFASGSSGIQIERLTALFGADWGLCRTSADNIERTRDFIAHAYAPDEAVARRVDAQLGVLRALLHDAPKTLAWRLRAVPGRWVQWQNSVDDL